MLILIENLLSNQAFKLALLSLLFLYFTTCSYFSLLFLENVLLSLLFHSKNHLHYKNTESLARILEIILDFFFREQTAKTPQFLIFNQNVSLFC